MFGESVEILRLALPNVLAFTSLIFGSWLLEMTLRSKDLDAFNAVGYGSFIFSIFGLAVGLGLSSALDTLVSQAMGEKDEKAAAFSFSQARLVTLISCLPSIALLVGSVYLLRLDILGQSKEIIDLCYLYIKIQFIGILPLFWSNAVGCFLRAANRTKAPLIANILGCVIQGCLGLLFFNYINKPTAADADKTQKLRDTESRVVWASIISVFTNFIRWIYLEGYISFSLPENERALASLRCFVQTMKSDGQKLVNGITGFVKLAIPCCLMLWSEWFAAEVQTLTAGFGDKDGVFVNANLTLAKFSVLIFMFPVGISGTASYLVGSKLGEGNGAAAKKYAITTIGVISVLMVFLCFVVYLLKDWIISNEEKKEVIEQIEESFIYLCLFMWIDGVQNVVEGILRGMSLQTSAVYVKMFAMLGVRFILGIYFFHSLKLHVKGLWIAAAIGMLVSCLTYAYFLVSADFEEAAKKLNKKQKEVEI